MEFRLPEIGEGLYEAEVSRLAGQARRRGSAGPGAARSAHRQGDHGSAGAVHRHHSGLHAEAGKQIKVGEVVLTYEGQGTPRRRRRP